MTDGTGSGVIYLELGQDGIVFVGAGQDGSEKTPRCRPLVDRSQSGNLLHLQYFLELRMNTHFSVKFE